MTNRYAHELQAACEAVKLAARLCTVRLCSISMEFENAVSRWVDNLNSYAAEIAVTA